MKNIIQIILAVTLTASISFGVTQKHPLYIGTTGMHTEMTNNYPLTCSAGDLLYSDATNSVQTLTIGATSKFLTVAASLPAWSAYTLPAAVGGTGTFLRSDGTNFVASTPTIPNAFTTGDTVIATGTNVLGVVAGAATGKIYQAQGAGVSPVFSPYTMPAAIGSANTFLRSDGTNLIASAVTWPNSVASGVLVYGNGTNAVGTLGIQAVGKILRSTGTLPSWSTATYPDTTTANQILYSSATNTIGQITTAATSALVTNSSSVPSLTSGTTANRVLRTDGTTVSFAQVAAATDISGILPVANGGSDSSNQQTGAFWSNTGNNGQSDGTSNFLGTTDAMPIRVVSGGTTGGNHKFDIKNAVNNIFQLFPEDFSTSVGGNHSMFYSANNMTWGGGTTPSWRGTYLANTHTLSAVNISNFRNDSNEMLVTTLGSAANRSISNYQSIYENPTLRGDGRDLSFTNVRFIDDLTATNIANAGTVTVSNWDEMVLRPTIGSGTTVTQMKGIWITPTNNGTLTTYTGMKITPPTATTVKAIEVDSGASTFNSTVQVGTSTASTSRMLGITNNGSAGNTVLFLKGAASQTGLYQEIQDSSGSAVATLTSTKIFRLYGTTSGFTGLKAAATVGTSTDFTLPTEDGTSGQVLKTDGSGNLSWVTSGAAKKTFTFMGGDASVGGNVTTALAMTGVAHHGIYVPTAMTCTNITMLMDANRTAGTVTANWAKDGVNQTGNCAISTATDRCAGTMSVNIAANSVITLSTTTASFTPTGNDVSVYLVCQEQ